MNTPKISVIIVTCNDEKHLSCCLDSIIGQSYRNIEIILVDNGSLDGTARICDGYAVKDSRIWVVHLRRRGREAAKAAGLSLASGDYICYLDTRCVLNEDVFEQMIRNGAQENGEVRLIAQGRTRQG